MFPVVSGVREWLSGAIAAPPAGAGGAVAGVHLRVRASALALADKAGTMAFQGFPAGTDYSYRTAELYSLSRLMAARTIGLGTDGARATPRSNPRSARLRLRNALRDLRWSPGFGEGGKYRPFSACRSRRPKPCGACRTALQADEPDRVVDDVLLERARRIEAVWRRYYGSTPQAPSRYLLPTRSVTETVMRPWITRQTVGTLRVWAELVAAARTPWPGRVDAAAAMAAKYGSDHDPRSRPSSVGPLAAIRRRAFYERLDAYEIFARIMRPDDLVKHRASVAAIAVERYRRDHAGALPGSLQDLAPQYLDAVPQDPVTGAPLLVQEGRRRVHHLQRRP